MIKPKPIKMPALGELTRLETPDAVFIAVLASVADICTKYPDLSKPILEELIRQLIEIQEKLNQPNEQNQSPNPDR